jgi:hypothetical protein
MGNSIKVSKPVSTETKHQQVYEFTPLGKDDKKKIVTLRFVDRGKGEVWNSDRQRDKIFSTIYADEIKGSGLANRTLIEVHGLNDAGEFEYSYRQNGALVKHSVLVDDAQAAQKGKSVSSKLTYFKVQQVSLRQFKQVELSNALIEFLKALVDFLATPFAYLYRLITGGGEPADFASMLVPPEHDRVGEVTHDAVLSQMRFMGRLFAEEDRVNHSRGVGLGSAPQQENIWYAGQYRPLRQTATHYKIWLGAEAPIKNPDYDATLRETLNNELQNAKANGRPQDIQKALDEIEKAGDAAREEIWPSVWVDFEKTDPNLARLAGHNQKNHYYLGSKQVEFKGEWFEIPKDDPSVKYPIISTIESDQPIEEERNPHIFSATQRASRLFIEAHDLGKEMQEALNSGSKKRAEKAIRKLTARLENIKDNKHLILPIGQGEGREYLPHFLVFVYDENANRVFLKHVCFSSTSLDQDKMQVVTTYDVTQTVQDEADLKCFCRSLFAMQPYSRKKDAKEIKLKGPLVRDLSLDSLLLNFGKVVLSQEGPVERKSSRDPVKAIYTVLEELQMQENPRLSAQDHSLGRITASKAHFYTVYVNHLISYYEENEGRLMPKERAHALDGILWYAKQVRHYMENEAGADTALAVTEHLIEFVSKKLDELQRTEALEQKDIQNLKNKVSLFEVRLAIGLEEALQRVDIAKDVEGSRVSPKEWAAVLKLRNEMQKTDLEGEAKQEARAEILTHFRKLQQRASAYLKENNPLAAKTLLLGILQALPPSDNPDDNKTFWDALSEEELSKWVRELEKVSEKMLEATLRSGTYPLKPHEVFELNVVVPLTQRYLFQRLIPFKLEAIEGNQGLLKTYKNDPQLLERLEAERKAFITLREKEIETEVTARLQKQWKQEDKEDGVKLSVYSSELKDYQTMLANYEMYRNDPEVNVRMAHPHPGQVPSRPVIRKETNNRKQELADEIKKEKSADSFLLQLKAIDVSTFDVTWDEWIEKGHPRTIAVFGKFARLMRIPAQVYAYKMGSKRNSGGSENCWLGQTFDSLERSIWLMNKDCSVLVGSSPAFEERYGACKRTLEKIKSRDKVDPRTQVGDEAEAKLMDQATYYGKGYFNPGEGNKFFVPEEMASIRKVDEMRKILREPVEYLTPFSSGGVLSTLMGFLGNEALNSEELRKRFVSMPEIHLVAASRQNIMSHTEGCFTLSKKEGEAGNLATNNKAEVAASHTERRNYLGQMTPEMASEKVGGDNERAKIEDVAANHLYKELDPAEEFILRETALAKSDPLKQDELSYLTISQCMHFIYQYPEKLEIPQVQHTLYKNFFQQGLIKKHLKDNPAFFVRFGNVLNEVCAFLQTKEDTHRVSELFIREVCERIRRQAFALSDELNARYGKDWASEISAALPLYNAKNIVGIFNQNIDSKEQKVFATFALSYFCRNVPKADDLASWGDLLKAFYIMQKSPFESGHSGLQAELLYEVQRNLLPRIAVVLAAENGRDLRNRLLNQLSGKHAEWSANAAKPYVYTTEENGKTFEIDIRTGQGFNLVMQKSERCRLPEQIRSDMHFRFLFKDANPIVVSSPGDNGVVDYHWKDERGGSEFLLRYRQADRTLQIFQIVQGKTYQFQKLDLSTKMLNKIWQLFARHNNKTIETMIKTKGVWVYVDENGKQDVSKVMLAQHGINLEKDPITLNVRGSKIQKIDLFGSFKSR